MLDNFRKRTNNIAFSFLIIVIAVVMAMFGVDQAQQSRNQEGGAAAWVNGQMISYQEFQNTLQNQLAGLRQELRGQLDEKLILSLGLPQRALKQLIQMSLLEQKATEWDFRIPDEELADHIRNLPYFQVNGQFDASLYQRLPNRGLEEKRQRSVLKVGKLQDYMQDRVKVTPGDEERQVGLQRVSYNLKFAPIDFAQMAKNYRPTNAEIDDFLKSTSPQTLEQYYNAHAKAFEVPARYRIRQIRVGLPFGATEEKKQAAQKKINEVMPKLNPGNFEALAKQYSDDEYAQSGGNRGWVDANELEPEILAGLSGLKANGVSAAIEAPGGYYALQLLEQKEKGQKPLDSVKQQVATELLKEQHRTEFEKTQKEKWNALLAEGKSIEADLKAKGVEVQTTGAFSLDQEYIPKIGPADELWESILSLKTPGAPAKQLVLSQGKYYYLALSELKKNPPSKDNSLKEAGSALQSRLQGELFNAWINNMEKNARIKTVVDFGTPAMPS